MSFKTDRFSCPINWVFERSESIKELERKVKAAGFKETQAYKVDFITYKPVKGILGVQPLCLIHHSVYPWSSFLLSPEMPDGRRSQAVASRSFDNILAKFTPTLIPDNVGAFECAGNEYQKGDFVLRLGVSTMNNTSTKGVIVEAIYLGSCSMHSTIRLMSEFIESVIGSSVQVPSHIAKRHRKTPAFQSIDTFAQYEDIFSSMRKRTGSVIVGGSGGGGAGDGH